MSQGHAGKEVRVIHLWPDRLGDMLGEQEPPEKPVGKGHLGRSKELMLATLHELAMGEPRS